MEASDNGDDPEPWWKAAINWFTKLPQDTYEHIDEYAKNDLTFMLSRGRKYDNALREGKDPSLVDDQYQYDKAQIQLKNGL